MVWAVVRTGNKQYRVSSKDIIVIEKISGEVGHRVDFTDILLLVDDGKVVLGRPIVKNTKVKAIITGQGRGKKIRVTKFKPKSRYLRNYGAKKKISTVQIESIAGS